MTTIPIKLKAKKCRISHYSKAVYFNLRCFITIPRKICQCLFTFTSYRFLKLPSCCNILSIVSSDNSRESTSVGTSDFASAAVSGTRFPTTPTSNSYKSCELSSSRTERTASGVSNRTKRLQYCGHPHQQHAPTLHVRMFKSNNMKKNSEWSFIVS